MERSAKVGIGLAANLIKLKFLLLLVNCQIITHINNVEQTWLLFVLQIEFITLLSSDKVSRAVFHLVSESEKTLRVD